MRSFLSHLGSFAITILIATFVAFALLQLVPGDPATAIAGEYATPERLAEIRSDLGLDQPVVVQYGEWLSGAVQGDLGESLYSGEDVMDVIVARLPATLQLVGLALVFSLLVGIPAGIIAARRAATTTDRAVTGAATLGIAVPNFWLAMILVSIFALNFGWFPATGFRGISDGPTEFLRYAALPAIALGSAGAAEVARQLRGSLLDVFASDYMRTARSKGLSSRVVMWRHAIRNTGVTMVTVIGLLVSRLVGATVVVEAVFAIPGAGSMVVEAVEQRDYPVIQGMVLALALVVLVVNAIVDFLYRSIDPRID